MDPAHNKQSNEAIQQKVRLKLLMFLKSRRKTNEMFSVDLIKN